jgi:hypothetical protein
MPVECTGRDAGLLRQAVDADAAEAKTPKSTPRRIENPGPCRALVIVIFMA